LSPEVPYGCICLKCRLEEIKKNIDPYRMIGKLDSILDLYSSCYDVPLDTMKKLFFISYL